MTEEDRAFFAYFRSVFKRYNISPSKATRLEYDFVTRVAESEFYLQKINPPVPTLPEFEVLAVTAAECEKGAAINGEDLAAHHVKNIRCDQMRPAATPSDCAKTLFQDVEIFVAAVYKSDGERHFTQFFQILFFLAGTVPDKTEVTADNENIAGFQLFENGIFES